MFPRWLGVLLVAGSVGFLVDTILVFLAPGVRDALDPVVGTLTSVAELVMIAWLLIRGARVGQSPNSPSVPAPTAAT
jgi:hypothetical protein